MAQYEPKRIGCIMMSIAKFLHTHRYTYISVSLFPVLVNVARQHLYHWHLPTKALLKEQAYLESSSLITENNTENMKPKLTWNQVPSLFSPSAEACLLAYGRRQQTAVICWNSKVANETNDRTGQQIMACRGDRAVGYPEALLYFLPGEFGGTRWRSWLRHCTKSRKVAGSIPDCVIGVPGIFPEGLRAAGA